MDVATIHAVGPGDIIGERDKHAVDVPRVEAIVDAFKDFEIIVHWVSPGMAPTLRQITYARIYLSFGTYKGVRCHGSRCAFDARPPDQPGGARVRPPQRSAAQAAWLRRRISASAGRATGWPGKHAT